MPVVAGNDLNNLCAICHVNPLKYTCPRCGIHTCSLPCVKRHKQWAQCSGVRDPAEYRKRSELATPASIDKDFNFITSVERSLERADDGVLERKIDLTPARVWKGDSRSKVDIETRERNITVLRAPKGLSRSKQNKTKWAGQLKCLQWTVEWIEEDGHKTLNHVPETRTIQEASPRPPSRGGNRLKRKRVNEDNTNSHHVTVDDQSARLEQTSSHRTSGEEFDSLHATSDAQEKSIPPVTSKDSKRQDETENNASEDTSTHMVDTEATDKSHPRPTDENSVTKKPDSSDQYFFYLHRPNTQARYKCLIPISPSHSLKDVLDNKTLLEFPTIYVKKTSPSQLEEPFISEEEYEKRSGVDIPINIVSSSSSVPSIPDMRLDATGTSTLRLDDDSDVENGEVNAEVEAEDDDGGHKQPDLDEAKVLEVLAHDLAG